MRYTPLVEFGPSAAQLDALGRFSGSGSGSGCDAVCELTLSHVVLSELSRKPALQAWHVEAL